MSGSLPGWLADWLQLPPGGDGATWQLDSAWTWAPWATVLLTAIAIVWTAMLYKREQSPAGRVYRAGLVSLRLIVMATLLVMIAQWALAIRLTGPPAIVVVIDRSASMEIVDRYEDANFTDKIPNALADSKLGPATRLNLAKWLLAKDDGRLLNELAKRYRVDVYLVAEGVERLPRATDVAEALERVRDLSAEGPGRQTTRLGDAIRRVLDDYRGNPPAAILLLTDGVSTAGLPLADAAQESRRKGVPLVSVGVGSEQSPRDIELVDVLVDDAVFKGDLVSFQIRLKSSGLEAQPAKVTLRRGEGGEPDSQIEETITLPPTGQMLTLQLVDRPKVAGELAYSIEVTPRDDETDLENNKQQRTVAVRDEKIRVLLVQGYPNYEFRFLKSLLERDASIELATYLQDADPDFSEQDKTALRSFPVTRDEIFSYDVLLIGDLDPRLLPPSVWQHVRAFVVEKGGGAAFVAGPRYLPRLYQSIGDVRALLPAELGGLARIEGDYQATAQVGEFMVRPTALGAQSPPMQLGNHSAETEAIWQSLAPQFWLVQFGELKSAAQILATTSVSLSGEPTRTATPVILFQYTGAGRVLLHAIDSTWLWRRGVGDAYFARYWVQSIRYLARGKLSGGRGVQLTSDRREYRNDEEVQLRVRFLDPQLSPSGEEVALSIESPGRPRQRIVLRRNAVAAGVFEGTMTDLKEGSYQVLVTEPQLPGDPPATRFSIVAPPGELSRPEMDRAALVAAANATRGQFYTLEDAGRLLEELPPGRPVPLENLPPYSIWNRWWLISLFLTCLIGEWILRKRKGML